MKIHLHVGQPPINGYNNVDLTTNTIDLKNLDKICERAECTQMILNNILGYITFDQISSLLSQLITRLRLKGQIIINDCDFSVFVDSYSNGLIDIKHLNNVIFGVGQVKKCSCFNVSNIQDILIKNHLRIESVELNSGKFIIIGKRAL